MRHNNISCFRLVSSSWQFSGSARQRACLFFLFLVNIIGLQGQSAMPLEEEVAMEHSFLAPTLQAVQLDAFQQRAQQKLQDFANLVGIISNPAYDLALRKASIPMALRLFDSPTATIRYYDFVEKKEQRRTLSAYLDELLLSKLSIQIEFKILSTTAIQQKDKKYHWQLVFLQMQKDGTTAYPNLKGEIDVILAQKEKKFGQQGKLIWEVQLSDMATLQVVNP